jgi:hypothetical protein
MEEVIKQQENTETGRDTTGENKQSREWQARSIEFETLQGTRRRHPTRVLSQYTTIADTNQSPHTTWEKALEEENDVSNLPKVYTTQGQQMAVQLGVVQTAEENFRKSKNNRLSTMHLASV